MYIGNFSKIFLFFDFFRVKKEKPEFSFLQKAKEKTLPEQRFLQFSQ